MAMATPKYIVTGTEDKKDSGLRNRKNKQPAQANAHKSKSRCNATRQLKGKEKAAPPPQHLQSGKKKPQDKRKPTSRVTTAVDSSSAERKTLERGTLITRRIFITLVGCIYTYAFICMFIELHGLIGSRGVIPADAHMASLRDRAIMQLYWYQYPSLFWVDWSPYIALDTLLSIFCAAGLLSSLFLAAGVFPLVSAWFTWVIYLSFTIAGETFFDLKWDRLLLETGFLAALMAPSTADGYYYDATARRWRDLRPRIVTWLCRILFIRLLGSMAVVHLWNADDATWPALTAFDYLPETTPLPTRLGFWIHRNLFPEYRRVLTAAVWYGGEMAVPAVAALRVVLSGNCWLTKLAFYFLLVVQLFMMFIDNLVQFRILIIALGVIALLSDGVWPSRWIAHLNSAIDNQRQRTNLIDNELDGDTSSSSESEDSDAADDVDVDSDNEAGQTTRQKQRTIQKREKRKQAARRRKEHRQKRRMERRHRRQTGRRISALVGVLGSVAALLLCAVYLLASVTVTLQLTRRLPTAPTMLVEAYDKFVSPFRIVNKYGVPYLVLTEARPDVVIQASDDVHMWHAYKYRCRPPTAELAWICPYVPRIEWKLHELGEAAWENGYGQSGGFGGDSNAITGGRAVWFPALLNGLLTKNENIARLFAESTIDKAERDGGREGRPPVYTRGVLVLERFSLVGNANGTVWQVSNEDPLTQPYTLNNAANVPYKRSNRRRPARRA